MGVILTTSATPFIEVLASPTSVTLEKTVAKIAQLRFVQVLRNMNYNELNGSTLPVSMRYASWQDDCGSGLFQILRRDPDPKMLRSTRYGKSSIIRLTGYQ